MDNHLAHQEAGNHQEEVEEPFPQEEALENSSQLLELAAAMMD